MFPRHLHISFMGYLKESLWYLSSVSFLFALLSHAFSHALFLCLQTTSSALKGAIQLGIAHTVGSLSQKAERDVLMQDFYVVESIFFPRCVYEKTKDMCVTTCVYVC